MKNTLKKGCVLLLALISAGLAKSGEFDFQCPCKWAFNFAFFFVYLLGPMIVFLIFGIWILRHSQDPDVISKCCECFITCTVPPVAWMIMFFSGKYMDCFKDELKEGYSDIEKQFLMDVCYSDQAITDEQLTFYAKRAASLGFVILLLLIALIHDCCKNSCQNENDGSQDL
ncbi:hypothetical protein MHYP_G00219260 [Metynnis hypsauchen]